MRIEPQVENTLLNLLKAKPFTQIYVSDLLEEAGICKGTFYKYYRDKYALLQRCFRNHYYGEIEAHSQNFDEFAFNTLVCFRKTPKIVLHAMIPGESESIYGYNARLFSERLASDRRAAGKTADGEPCGVFLRLYAENVTGLIFEWLGERGARKAEEMMAVIRGAMPRWLLEN